MKPAPPKICTASEAQKASVVVAWFFSMQISAIGSSPCSSRQVSISNIACEASIRIAMFVELMADNSNGLLSPASSAKCVSSCRPIQTLLGYRRALSISRNEPSWSPKSTRTIVLA